MNEISAPSTDPHPTLSRGALDPITVEVIGSALSSITEEMGEALVRASYSTNIKERRDCSTALFDTAGTTLCQAEHIPMHLGSFIGIIPHILKRHDAAEMRPGDVFVGNDAFEGGGTHLPDLVLAEPIFVDGAITAWAVNTAHHADFADRGHQHIYQEGLRIPPIRLYRAGTLQADVQALILLNCQVPHERLSDLRAQMAANRLGVQRMAALCDRYGRDVVLAAGRALQDYAERKMRAGIAAIPDGTYRFADRYDGPEFDGELDFSVAITIDGDEMRLDFDAPPQLRAGINMTYTALLSTVYYAVKTVVDPTVLPNSGLARPISVTATEGSVVNCVHPAAVNGRIGPCQRVVDLIHGALAQAVPDRVIAACNGSMLSATFVGARPDRSLWVYLETIGGGSGARATKDGLDGVHVHMTNTSNLPVEALEGEYPLTLLAYELVNGSGGVGRSRGGMGLRRVYRAEAECRLRIDGSRFISRPWGLEGGGEGSLCSFSFSPGVAPFVHGNGTLMPGDVVEIITPGAGGYGPPLSRDRALVARDLREGRIDQATAVAAYHFEPSPAGGRGRRGLDMNITRRALIAGSVALPFLRVPARAARTPGQLVFGLSSYPPNFNPWVQAGTAAGTVNLQVHRGLTSYGADGNLRGELAETWARDGEAGWVFTLRDATFHNGAKVTAADVKYSLEQVASPKSTAYMRGQFQGVDHIDTPDPRTVRIVMKEPTETLPLWLAAFSMPVVAAGSAEAGKTPIGCGPFMITKQERGVSIDLEANPHFYKPGLPKLKKLRFVVYADETARVAALQTGDVDLIEYVPWQSMAGIEADPKLRLQNTEGPFMYLTFNGATGPFKDPKVRLAVARAVKRDEIVKSVFYGRGAALAGPPIVESSPFYDKTLAEGWAYDPAKAKSLLAEAGLAGGFACTLLATAQYSMHKDTAEIVQQNLAAIGIQVELALPDWATRISLGNRGQYQFAVNGTTADSNDPDGLTAMIDSTLGGSATRSYDLKDETIAKLLGAGRAEFDPAKRAAIYTDLQKQIIANTPIVSLAWRAQGYAMAADVKGFTNMPGALTFFSGTTLEETTLG